MRHIQTEKTFLTTHSGVVTNRTEGVHYFAKWIGQHKVLTVLLGCWVTCLMEFPVVVNAAPLTGPRLNTALASPARRSWTEFPLRQVLDQLAESHRVSIVLDRRVDPSQETSLDAQALPLGETLDQVAGMVHARMGYAHMVNTEMVSFGSIVYIGPEETARLLSCLAEARREEVRQMPDRGRAMLTAKPMRWDDLSTPRGLLQALAEETGVSIGPMEAIPHDLWAAAELPPSTAVDRLTLILAQFDKTFSLAADTVNGVGKPQLVIVDIPESMKQSVAAVTEAEPEIKTTQGGPNGKARTGSTPSTDLARLRIKRFAVQEKPVGVVIEYLARQWNLTLEVDREKFDDKLKQRINVTEENVTVPNLIRAILAPVGLEGELDPKEGVLRIRTGD